MQTLTLNQFWQKSTKSFVAEVSELKESNFIYKRESFIGVNSKTNTELTFKFVSLDTDGSGEDIYGFRYEGITTDNKVVKVLFIND